jgi:predicted metal-dependent phosphotriesterase family hydrolase
MENFIREMLDHGIPEKDIILMTRDNPAAMLGI